MLPSHWAGRPRWAQEYHLGVIRGAMYWHLLGVTFKARTAIILNEGAID